MDLCDQLIESTDRRQKGAGKFSIASIVVHGVIVAFIVFMSMSATHKVAAEKPIHAFLTAAAPPPPPPSPPAGSSAPTATPKPTIKQMEVPQPTFLQPTEIPKELPKVEAPTISSADVAPSTSEPAGGQPGGLPGGVAGGVVGGQAGGQLGGTLGRVQGGVVGGTGEAKEPPPPPPPPAPDDGALPVGGDVKALVVIHRFEPPYNDIARKVRIQGVVVVEAIIDKNGNVDKVRVLKGLSMGLTEAAEEAVKQ